MINPEDVLYAPHPVEDLITSEQVQDKVDYLQSQQGNPDTFLQQGMCYQVLRLAGVIEEVYYDPAFLAVHREHVAYVQRANNGGVISPAYEAELIVEKAAIRDSLPPQPLAA